MKSNRVAVAVLTAPLWALCLSLMLAGTAGGSGDTGIIHGDTSVSDEELLQLYADKVPVELFLQAYCKKMAPVLFHHKEHVDRKVARCANCHHLKPKEQMKCDECHSLAPVEEKAPDLEAADLAHPLKAEVAFALGHLGRYEEAIALYSACVKAEPSNFHFHAGLAYAAYDSLYAAKTRKVTLHPAERRTRIDLAHRHFAAARDLRPEAVTNFYRQGMLFKQIQGKPDKGLPLFETAVRNWRLYSEEQKQARHQERKNYVKSLYQLASCLLDGGRPRLALEQIEACIREDEASMHLSVVHKTFALGKVHFALGDLDAARRALEAAAAQADPSENDYVFELLAQVHLARRDVERAWEAVNRVPPPRRRPYFRWTEADVLAARGDLEQACRVLRAAAGRDRRGSHKALVRLARIEFRRHRYSECLEAAGKAREFFQAQYQNPFYDGLFWTAAALLRLGRPGEARSHLAELESLKPDYPHLGRLRELIEAAG
jgi:tetratricopeptide (TPR) repeat protein